MPNRGRKKRPNKIRPVSAKEVSVLAWIQDAYGNVLLIQQTAGKQLWSLPGGKVRSTEALKPALRRELKEEIGLTLVSAKWSIFLIVTKDRAWPFSSRRNCEKAGSSWMRPRS